MSFGSRIAGPPSFVSSLAITSMTPDTTLNYIIDNYTEKEDGVRNLKRCIEIVYKKLNLYRLVKPGTTLFEKDNTLVVQFPFTVTNEIVNNLIKKDESGIGKAAINMYL
jgi:ATP-dependent Lon protease